MNGLARSGRLEALGADTGLARARSGALAAASRARHARGDRLDNGDEDWTLDLIDDAFNANPARWPPRWRCWPPAPRATISGGSPRAGASPSWATCWNWARTRPRCTARWRICRIWRALTTVHCVGPRMRALWDALPRAQRGQWADQRRGSGAPGAWHDRRGRRAAGQGIEGQQSQRIVDALRKSGRATARRDKG